MYRSYFKTDYLENLFDKHVSQKLTRGLDGVSVPAFQEKKRTYIETLAQKIDSDDFVFSPYLEKLKARGRDKEPRVISIPTVRDRVVLLALKNFLHMIFPECIQRRLPNEYVRDVKKYYLDTNKADLCFYKSDIKSFYDTIDQNILIEKIEERVHTPLIIQLIKKSYSKSNSTKKLR